MTTDTQPPATGSTATPPAAIPAADDSRARWRVRLGAFVTSPLISNLVIGLIVVNAVTLGLETSDSIRRAFGEPLHAFNMVALVIYVVEIGVKLIAFGPRFFRSGWNIFDFVIVAIALVPAGGGLTALRTLRALRVLRLLTKLRQLREIIDAIGRSLTGLGWTTLLLLLIFYVFAIMGTEMFGRTHPEFFGTLGGSMYSLFQVMTLESWSMGIARPVIAQHPLAWLYFVPFILIASFMVLNLFIAIIVNATQSLHSEEVADDTAAILAHLETMHARLDELSAQLADARAEGRLAGSIAPDHPEQT